MGTLVTSVPTAIYLTSVENTSTPLSTLLLGRKDRIFCHHHCLNHQAVIRTKVEDFGSLLQVSVNSPLCASHCLDQDKLL